MTFEMQFDIVKKGEKRQLTNYVLKVFIGIFYKSDRCLASVDKYYIEITWNILLKEFDNLLKTIVYFYVALSNPKVLSSCFLRTIIAHTFY